MADIRLIATDLDGTLIGSANEFHLYESFRDTINELRVENKAIWVVCTGRSLHGFFDVFTAMRILGAVPDMVVARHAYIYSKTIFGYMPHVLWNMRIMLIQRTSARKAQKAVKYWHDMLASGSFGRASIQKGPERLLIRLDSEDATKALFDVINKELSRYLSLRVFKFKNEIDIRSVPFTKGLALSEIQKHLAILPGNTLSVGDGHNDVSMFFPSVSALIGCPSNSAPEVMLDVHEKGGHVSRYSSLEGVLDIIQAHRRKLVDSSLPADWKSPEYKTSPKMKGSKSKGSKSLARFMLWSMGGYVVLSVFATFRLLPLSGLILLPLKVIMKVIAKVMEYCS